MNHFIETCFRAQPWNKGNLVGQKAPRRLKEIWVIHIGTSTAALRAQWSRVPGGAWRFVLPLEPV